MRCGNAYGLAKEEASVLWCATANSENVSREGESERRDDDARAGTAGSESGARHLVTNDAVEVTDRAAP